MSGETEQRNLKTIQDLFGATGSGNWPAAEGMLTEDFFVTEAPNNPFAGVFRGRKALQNLFSQVVAAAEVSKMEVKGITAGGEYVIALVELTVGNPGAVVPLAEVFRLREGKVCEIKPYYFDPTPLAQAVAAKKKLSA